MQPGPGKEGATPAKRQPLWLLDRADDLIRGIGMAAWLSVASVFRLTRALVARDSVARIDALLSSQRILPPTLGLFVAAIATALTITWEALPTEQQIDTLQRASSTSAENWLLVAGPALVSLWLSAALLGWVLRLAIGRHALDPTATLMHTVSAVTMLLAAMLLAFELLPGLSVGVRKAFKAAGGFVLAAMALALIALLAVAGARFAQQAFAGSSSAPWRRCLVGYVLAPLCFVGALPAALAAQVWFSNTVMPRLLGHSAKGVSSTVPSYGAECFTVDNAVICQLVLRAYHDLTLGSLKALRVQMIHAGQNVAGSVLLAALGQVEQRSPRADTGTFWKLRRFEPTPVAFQIPKKVLCDVVQTIGMEIEPTQFGVGFRADWHPGFTSLNKDGKSVGFSTDFHPEFATDLLRFCGRRVPRAAG